MKNKIAQRFDGTKGEEKVSLVVQDKKDDEPVTYSEVDPPRSGEEAEPLSHSDNLKSIKSALSGIISHEEKELMPIEHEVTDSSTPYFLMK